MDSIQELFAYVMAVVGIVSTLIARFQATSSELGFFTRVFIVLDLSQVFDSSRSLGDGPDDLDDGEGFDDPVEE